MAVRLQRRRARRRAVGEVLRRLRHSQLVFRGLRERADGGCQEPHRRVLRQREARVDGGQGRRHGRGHHRKADQPDVLGHRGAKGRRGPQERGGRLGQQPRPEGRRRAGEARHREQAPHADGRCPGRRFGLHRHLAHDGDQRAGHARRAVAGRSERLERARAGQHRLGPAQERIGRIRQLAFHRDRRHGRGAGQDFCAGGELCLEPGQGSRRGPGLGLCRNRSHRRADRCQQRAHHAARGLEDRAARRRAGNHRLDHRAAQEAKRESAQHGELAYAGELGHREGDRRGIAGDRRPQRRRAAGHEERAGCRHCLHHPDPARYLEHGRQPRGVAFLAVFCDADPHSQDQTAARSAVQRRQHAQAGARLAHGRQHVHQGHARSRGFDHHGPPRHHPVSGARGAFFGAGPRAHARRRFHEVAGHAHDGEALPA